MKTILKYILASYLVAFLGVSLLANASTKPDLFNPLQVTISHYHTGVFCFVAPFTKQQIEDGLDWTTLATVERVLREEIPYYLVKKEFIDFSVWSVNGAEMSLVCYSYREDLLNN